MQTINEINQELIKLWSEQTYSKIVPMIYPELTKNSLLFIGINPSYSPIKIKPVLKGTPYAYLADTEQSLTNFFTYNDQISENQITILQEIQRLHHEKYPFFTSRNKLVKEIVEQLPKESDITVPPLEHLDLFHVRVTDSQLLFKDIKQIEYLSFFQRQISLFKKILNYAEPRIVTIANAQLSNFLLGNYSQIKITGQPFEIHEYDKNDSGVIVGETYINHQKTPIIFFKQLTGGGTSKIERKNLISQIIRILT